MFRLLPLLLLLLLLLLPFATTQAISLASEHQRTLFTAAERAFEQGERGEYNRLKRQLANYPLYPYLLYGELRQRLWTRNHAEVSDFLTRYGDTPMADWLRRDWLRHLAERKAWGEFLEIYQTTSNAELQCLRLQALYHTGRLPEMLAKTPPLWLTGRSQHTACDAPFALWREAGGLTSELVWERIRLALAEDGGSRLARYLGRYLPPAERPLLELWLRVEANPELVNTPSALAISHPLRQSIIVYGMQRLLARRGSAEAITVWKQVKPRYSFSSEQVGEVEEAIAHALLRANEEQALPFFLAMQPIHRSEELLDLAVRRAISRRNWPTIVTLVGEAPKERRSEYQRYWYGRALEQHGQRERSREVLRELAKSRTYHGFLAADRVALPYHLDNIPLTLDSELLKRVEQTPAVLRARELFILKRTSEANREWRHLMVVMEDAELQAFAKLAQGWRWHSRAIFTLARTGYWDDLELRFPLEHKYYLASASNEFDLDLSWVFAVLRQESAFVNDARSSAGALGLMQIMPATARDIARRLKVNNPSTSELLEPRLNIRFGSSYLRHLLNRFHQHPALATAAYNAGQGRINQWLPSEQIPADEWIATIPFNETRGYVERIFAYTVLYDTRLGLPPRRLSESMMQPIGRSRSE